MTPIAAQYKLLLEENGWTFDGECTICSGTAWKFSKGNHVIKVRKDRDRFTMKGPKVGTLAPMKFVSLEMILNKYGLAKEQPGS